MKTLLYINCCPRGTGVSRTDRLCRHFLAHLPAGIQVEEVDATQTPLLRMPDLEKRDALVKAKKFDDPMFTLAQQLIHADYLLFGAPYWDLSCPASLKAYLEQISVCGLSFYYNEAGQPVGCCQGQRLIYVTTAGGPIGKLNFGYDYVAGLFATLLGIPNASFISAENLDIVGRDPEPALQQAEEMLEEMANNL